MNVALRILWIKSFTIIVIREITKSIPTKIKEGIEI